MEDIVEFLTACYADDERVAREASGGTVVGCPGNWKPAPTGDEWEAHCSPAGDVELLVALRPNLPRPPDVMGGCWGAVFTSSSYDCDPDAWEPDPQFVHAARHDPARVLRDVEVGQAIIGAYLAAKEDLRKATETVDGWPDSSAGHHRGRVAAFEFVLRAKATSYADRPGFNPKWRVA